MGILREQLRQLRADLLPEGEHRVALRLLRAELSAGLEHADLRLRVRTQLVRLAPRVGDDLSACALASARICAASRFALSMPSFLMEDTRS